MEEITFLDTEVILKNLEDECKKLGLELEGLLEASQLDHRTIRSWLEGERTPHLSSLQVIQSLLNSYIREFENGEK